MGGPCEGGLARTQRGSDTAHRVSLLHTRQLNVDSERSTHWLLSRAGRRPEVGIALLQARTKWNTRSGARFGIGPCAELAFAVAEVGEGEGPRTSRTRHAQRWRQRGGDPARRRHDRTSPQWHLFTSYIGTWQCR